MTSGRRAITHPVLSVLVRKGGQAPQDRSFRCNIHEHIVFSKETFIYKRCRQGDSAAHWRDGDFPAMVAIAPP